MPVLPNAARIALIVPRVALGQYFLGVPGGSGPNDHWNDAEGALTFLLGPAGPDNSRGSYSSPCYVRGPGDTSNKISDFASWTLPPSYLAI